MIQSLTENSWSKTFLTSKAEAEEEEQLKATSEEALLAEEAGTTEELLEKTLSTVDLTQYLKS